MITVDKHELMSEFALKNWIIHSLIIGSPIFSSQALGIYEVLL